MVSAADTDALGVQEDVESVQSRQAGRVGQTGGVEERREESLEAGARGGGEAGVDVCVVWLGPLWWGGARYQSYCWKQRVQIRAIVGMGYPGAYS